MSIIHAAGLTGSKRLDGTSANTGSYQSFVANEDCVVTAVIDDKGVNVTADLGLGVGKIVYRGSMITIPLGRFMASITLASGSIIAYRA